MLGRYRFALRPGWLLWHLFVLAAIVTMILLGRWQLHVSESKHFDLQNFGYSLQWWLFAGFAGFFWWRILRDAGRHRAARALEPGVVGPGVVGSGVVGAGVAEPAAPAKRPVAYRRYVMPTAPAATDDPELAAYNDYLARLNEQSP